MALLKPLALPDSVAADRVATCLVKEVSADGNDGDAGAARGEPNSYGNGVSETPLPRCAVFRGFSHRG